MKKIILLPILMIASVMTFASEKPVMKVKTTISDRHFIVRFTYVGENGLLKIGEVGIICPKGYPKDIDVILKAADAVGVSCKCIKNTYPTAISKAEFDAIF